MGYVIGLVLALSALWLGMSGLMEPMILTLGAISVILSVWLAGRLGIIDRETSPYFRIFAFIAYAPWLIKEILKANLTVVKAVLSPKLDIHPALVKVPYTCKTDLGKVIFANSITLTPGTVTLRVDEDSMLVHGLYEADAQPEAFEEMDLRSAKAGDGGAGKGDAK